METAQTCSCGLPSCGAGIIDRIRATERAPQPGDALGACIVDALNCGARVVYPPLPMRMHTCDADCAPYLVDDQCTVCGVSHTGDCPECGGRGFHRPECPDNDNNAQSGLPSPLSRALVESMWQSRGWR